MGYTLKRDAEGKPWHVYFLTREGDRFRRTTKQTDKRKADVVAAELYRKLADPTYQAANSTSIFEASGNLIAHLKQRKRSTATVEHFYPTKLSQLARVLDKDLPLARIDAKMVDYYISVREDEGAAAYTISKELTVLRQLLKVARRRGEFDKELSQVMPIAFATGYTPRTRRLTIPEARRFIEALPDGVKRYVAFVCCTTARDAAVGRARGRHLKAGHIEVYDQKTKRSTRKVPLNAMTRPFAEYAFEGIGPDDPVCPGISSVRHAFDRATKRLGMAHVSPNDLRRSVAHWLLERGVPRAAAATFMGHANTKMLDLVYGKLDEQELGREIDLTLTLKPDLGDLPPALPPSAPADGGEPSAPSVPRLPEGSEETPENAGMELGRNLEEPAENVDGSDGTDDETAEKECPETESNRRHGDFQSGPGSRKSPTKSAVSTQRVDGSWNFPSGSQIADALAHEAGRVAGDIENGPTRRIRRSRRQAARDLELVARLEAGVALALAGNEEESDRNLQAISRLLPMAAGGAS